MPEILVEEYNDGYEFNMMTWVRHGKVHVISIADREKTFVAKGEIPISTRNVYPSRLRTAKESSGVGRRSRRLWRRFLPGGQGLRPPG